MCKYIIAVVADEKTGKTTVINNVWDLLPCYDCVQKHIDYNLHHEIVGYVRSYDNFKKGVFRNLQVGVNSIGDNVPEIRQGLVDMLFDGSDILVCACHKVDDLIEAMNSLTSTVLLKRMADRGIKTSFLPIAQSTIKDYKIICCSHFQKYIEPSLRKPIRHSTSATRAATMEVEGINLSRLSAQSIVNLIDQIINKP